ncbi:putative XkdQ-related protein [uncultured Caudovirales phage]|uniref:Putative XkdQ-related protein n=1 Tax=uncultured Caudovirales phage TaxID=2100421 RepID=A0A2H4J063_9CAUD|nr:putative XkdQ-related protein [uncultured Caudovirales phage]
MEVILKSNYKIQNLVEEITLAEALDGIAYTASIKLMQTEELKKIGINKGDSIKIIDISAESNKNTVIFNGVIWDKSYSRKTKEVNITCKERTVYLEESEDEYLFGEGTATQRINQYCKDWNIPTLSLLDTKIKLAKTGCRKETILSMMLKDLKETAQKGGNLYKLRMLDKLNLIQLGSNKVVWKLENIAEDVQEHTSLEGAVTQVKVLGKNDDESKSPVIGVYKKDNSKYGTLQKVIQDEKVTSANEAKKRAESLFNIGEDTIRVNCAKDINTIRAADKVDLNGANYYVIDITHNLNREMNINLGSMEYIRRKFYSGIF